ncbi:MAG: GntR family transcriptional regulator [Ruminococcus sp.]|nr:GntR family transcriptional regulator [Ruminococcus sp.]
MFQIDPLSRQPVYEQIMNQVEKFILNGILTPGSQIPSVRSISIEHSINPRTILKAYTELDGKGLLRAVPGKGYYVCEDALQILNKSNTELLGTLSKMVTNMALANVPEESVLQCVKDAYTKSRKEKAND